MKKSIAILIVLILCISILAGCGGGDDNTTSDAKSEQTTATPEGNTPTAPDGNTPTTPEPAPTPMETFNVPSGRFGGMSISYPEGTNVTIDFDESKLKSGEYNKFIYGSLNCSSDMSYEAAHVVFDDFGLVMGFKDFGRTYENYYESTKGSKFEKDFKDVEFGNAKGFAIYDTAYGFVYIFFPSFSDEYGRCIAVYTAESLEKEDPYALLDNPAILAVLETLNLESK
jgi:hypothetical protein